MLTELLPEDIPKYWDLIKHAMERGLPPVVHADSETRNRIFTSLLAGGMTCFVSHIVKDDQSLVEGIVLTSILEDNCSGTRNLLMYLVYGITKTTSETWIEGYEYFSKYARSRACTQFIGYTDVEKVKRIVEMFGGEARFTLITVPLDSE